MQIQIIMQIQNSVSRMIMQLLSGALIGLAHAFKWLIAW